MGQVFSRWPSEARLSVYEAPASTARVPRWMEAKPRQLWSKLPLLLVIVLVAILGAAVGLLSMTVTVRDIWFAALPALAMLAALGYAMTLRRAIALSNARYDAIFERAGISMWLEDWSAVATEVSALAACGITDLESHFATRPQELRELCARVIIKDVNAFTVEETGASGKQALTGTLDKLLPPTDQTFIQWLVAFAQGDRFFRSEAHVTRPDGSEIDTLFTAALPDDVDGFANILVTSLDITGYKGEQAKLLAAEAAIARALRISTVGALSASIAHEVNSPLAAVLANAQAALRWLNREAPDINEAAEAIAAIIADATRAKDVIVRTRGFITNAGLSMTHFDIVATAREATLLVERELRGYGAAIQIKAVPGLPLAIGDIVQTQQIFSNLLLNAAQAMSGQSGPKEITVSFEAKDSGVQVEISDTGPGIEPQQFERIFDPFYTTRPEGIGMGLAICRNCVAAQGGAIWASGTECGATIHFWLPSADG